MLKISPLKNNCLITFYPLFIIIYHNNRELIIQHINYILFSIEYIIFDLVLSSLFLLLSSKIILFICIIICEVQIKWTNKKYKKNILQEKERERIWSKYNYKKYYCLHLIIFLNKLYYAIYLIFLSLTRRKLMCISRGFIIAHITSQVLVTVFLIALYLI